MKDIMLNEIRHCSNGTKVRARHTVGGCEGCAGCGGKLFDIIEEIGHCDPIDRADHHNVIFEIVDEKKELADGEVTKD